MNTSEALEYWGLEPSEHAAVADQLANEVPELIAICEMERDDESGAIHSGRIAAWGVVLEDYTEVVSVDWQVRGRFASLDSAMSVLSHHADVGLARPA